MVVDTAIILCGGRGTRFRESAEAELVAQKAARNFKCYPPPRTSFGLETVKELCETPKCLVPVCGKPLVWHKVDQLARAGVKNIVLCAGKNTDVTRESLERLSWDHPASVSFSPKGFFASEDIGYISRAIKGHPADSHVIVTAGDCLTTTDYAHLATEHERLNGYLTIAIRNVEGDRLFIQDSVASLKFLAWANREASHNVSRYHHCSPLNAAIFRAWHNHEVLAVANTTDHININTILDLEKLVVDPSRFIPVSALGHPRVLSASPQERRHELGLLP